MTQTEEERVFEMLLSLGACCIEDRVYATSNSQFMFEAMSAENDEAHERDTLLCGAFVFALFLRSSSLLHISTIVLTFKGSDRKCSSDLWQV
uniref:Uncharacterized protein n=1 Tax=Caenorhabditis tropicalis TaxID=1561998 RepID=A0A1I7UPM2_9PELO